MIDEMTPLRRVDPPLVIRHPILEVLHPREHTVLLVVATTIAAVAAWWVTVVMGRPLWHAVAVFIAVLIGPLVVKWRTDAERYGVTAAVAGALLTVQTLHGVEHAYQWFQRHVLDLPLRRSNGLLSPANTEWVHFVWNWAVLAAVVFLVVRGMRGWWALLFAGWVVAHTFEHSYMLFRYLEVSGQLDAFGFPQVTAQGLPGIVGRDGWFDRNGGTSPIAVICRLPFVTTATRLDTHAAWNVGETLLMIPAVRGLLRDVFRRELPPTDESGSAGVADDELDRQVRGR